MGDRTVRWNNACLGFKAFVLLASISMSGAANLLPSYIWPMVYIYNDTIPVTPPMTVHGAVLQSGDRGLLFQGTDGYADAGDFTGKCVAEPHLCNTGLSIALRVKFDRESGRLSLGDAVKYVFDTGGHFGKGISVFQRNEKLVVEVGRTGLVWKTNVQVSFDKWHFILATWSTNDGLFVYVDGPLLASSTEPQEVTGTADASSNNVVIGRRNAFQAATFGRFFLDMVALFDGFVPDGKILLSYSFSPPGQKNGNVRYVNARFINDADVALLVFPDRGAKKDTGYEVESKSSTLLEFVLKEGALPYGMDFAIMDTFTGVMIDLKPHGWLHVDSADDAQVVTEVTVTAGKQVSVAVTTSGIVRRYNDSTVNSPGSEGILASVATHDDAEHGTALKLAAQNLVHGHGADASTLLPSNDTESFVDDPTSIPSGRLKISYDLVHDSGASKPFQASNSDRPKDYLTVMADAQVDLQPKTLQANALAVEDNVVGINHALAEDEMVALKRVGSGNVVDRIPGADHAGLSSSLIPVNAPLKAIFAIESLGNFSGNSSISQQTPSHPASSSSAPAYHSYSSSSPAAAPMKLLFGIEANEKSSNNIFSSKIQQGSSVSIPPEVSLSSNSAPTENRPPERSPQFSQPSHSPNSPSDKEDAVLSQDGSWKPVSPEVISGKPGGESHDGDSHSGVPIYSGGSQVKISAQPYDADSAGKSQQYASMHTYDADGLLSIPFTPAGGKAESKVAGVSSQNKPYAFKSASVFPAGVMDQPGHTGSVKAQQSPTIVPLYDSNYAGQSGYVGSPGALSISGSSQSGRQESSYSALEGGAARVPLSRLPTDVAEVSSADYSARPDPSLAMQPPNSLLHTAYKHVDAERAGPFEPMLDIGSSKVVGNHSAAQDSRAQVYPWESNQSSLAYEYQSDSASYGSSVYDSVNQKKLPLSSPLTPLAVPSGLLLNTSLPGFSEVFAVSLGSSSSNSTVSDEMKPDASFSTGASNTFPASGALSFGPSSSSASSIASQPLNDTMGRWMLEESIELPGGSNIDIAVTRAKEKSLGESKLIPQLSSVILPQSELASMTPSRLWKGSMFLMINKGLPAVTSAHLVEDESSNYNSNFVNIGLNETLSGEPGMTLLLTEVKNGVITSAPLVTGYGSLRKWQGGLKLDGESSWIDASALGAGFLLDPTSSKSGFAVGFKVMFDSSVANYSGAKYVLDAGGSRGRGVAVFVSEGLIFAIISVNDSVCLINTTVIVEEWVYMMISWNNGGKWQMFVNGIKAAESSHFVPIQQVHSENKKIIIGADIELARSSFLLFYISAVDIVNAMPSTKAVLEFTPPIVKDDYIWTLSSIDGDHVAGYPCLRTYGGLKASRGALSFDGQSSHLICSGELADSFLLLPSRNPAGLTVAVKLKVDRDSAVRTSEEKFIIDTGGWLGHGVSLFVNNGKLTAVVGRLGLVWVAQTGNLDFTSWSLIIVTWRRDLGIYMYINGALVAKERHFKYYLREHWPSDSFLVGCNVLKLPTSCAKFMMSMMAVSPYYSTIDEIMKFSPPLVLRPAFDWFLVLVQNRTTLTSPPLRVEGGVAVTEDGLSFDGETGWLNAGTLDESSDENAEIICEHFVKDIACPPGRTIKVAYANYGRTSEIPCQGKRKYITTDCKSKTSLEAARSLCEGKRSCTLKALNTVWGNTCPGVIKYLDVRYQCVGDSSSSSDGEDRRAHFLLSPKLSKKGLTVLLKVKLDPEARRYSTPRFIIDSGGHKGHGVSLYTMNKALYCEVGTGDRMWRVSSGVSLDTWLYIVFSWSAEQGLVVYINGVIVAIASTPIIPARRDDPAGASFVVGGAVPSLPNSHAKFTISQLTVLKTLVGRSESFRLFSYYVGHTISNAVEESSMNHETSIICEYQSRNISCPVDQVIEIVFANYGRTSSRPCAWGTHQTSNCSLPSSISTARRLCNGRSSCKLTAKNSVWGNPCAGVIKYLEVKYICDELGPADTTAAMYVGNDDPNSLVIP